MFKVGDVVKMKDLRKVAKEDKMILASEMKFKGARKILGVYPMNTICAYKLEGMGEFLYTEGLLEKYNKEIQEEAEKSFKEVSLSQDNITLSRNDFMQIVSEVATEMVTNPPQELDFHTSMVLSMSTMVVGGLLEKKIFGDKEDE